MVTPIPEIKKPEKLQYLEWIAALLAPSLSPAAFFSSICESEKEEKKKKKKQFEYNSHE